MRGGAPCGKGLPCGEWGAGLRVARGGSLLVERGVSPILCQLRVLSPRGMTGVSLLVETG